MVGACIVFMTTSYVVPQGILAWRGRDKILPPRYLNLGRWGVWVNTLACVWVAFIDVIYCIPSAMPVTKNNMNWIRYFPLKSQSMWLLTCIVSLSLAFRLTLWLHGIFLRGGYLRDQALIRIFL